MADDTLPHWVEVSAQLPRADDDGRNIDRELGILIGEGAGQKPPGSRTDIELQAKAFPYIPSRQQVETPSYYDFPVLKQPVWLWSIPAYFYVGGVAGVGASLGAAAQLLAPADMRMLITRARWTATVGAAISSVLLIHDLGCPERFLNMLRVFRITSPMSMGSWILTCFSTCAGAAAVLPFGPRLFRPLAGVFGFFAGLFGLGLSGYTGVLLAQTAVPIWKQTNRVLPMLFLASGTAASASFLELFPANEKETATLECFALAGKIFELAFTYAFEAEARKVKRVQRPLHNGVSGAMWQTAKGLTTASALVSLVPGKSRAKQILSGVLGSAAGLCLRFGVFQAGKASAQDPRATFQQQRSIPAHSADPLGER